MRKVQLGKTGEQIPVLGQGTMGIKSGKDKEYYEKWKTTLRKGIELGMNHFDTAEIYNFGTSERIIGEVIKEYNRDDVFITSKLFPMHFGYKSMIKACNKSLKRLDTKYLDLYLVHFPSFGFNKIKKHMRVMEQLLNEGKWTKYRSKYFVSKLTAYSPLGHRGFTNLKDDIRSKLEQVANAHNASIQQIALAWLINHENVIAIPKAFQIEHVIDNAAAADIKLSEAEIKQFYTK